jgi:hypothetical protein
MKKDLQNLFVKELTNAIKLGQTIFGLQKGLILFSSFWMIDFLHLNVSFCYGQRSKECFHQ